MKENGLMASLMGKVHSLGPTENKKQEFGKTVNYKNN